MKEKTIPISRLILMTTINLVPSVAGILFLTEIWNWLNLELPINRYSVKQLLIVPCFTIQYGLFALVSISLFAWKNKYKDIKSWKQNKFIFGFALIIFLESLIGSLIIFIVGLHTLFTPKVFNNPTDTFVIAFISISATVHIVVFLGACVATTYT